MHSSKVVKLSIPTGEVKELNVESFKNAYNCEESEASPKVQKIITLVEKRLRHKSPDSDITITLDNLFDWYSNLRHEELRREAFNRFLSGYDSPSHSSDDKLLRVLEKIYRKFFPTYFENSVLSDRDLSTLLDTKAVITEDILNDGIHISVLTSERTKVNQYLFDNNVRHIFIEESREHSTLEIPWFIVPTLKMVLSVKVPSPKKASKEKMEKADENKEWTNEGKSEEKKSDKPLKVDAIHAGGSFMDTLAKISVKKSTYKIDAEEKITALLGKPCSLLHLCLDNYVFQFSSEQSYETLQKDAALLASKGITAIARAPSSLCNGLVKISAKLEFEGSLIDIVTKLSSVSPTIPSSEVIFSI